MTKRIKEKQAAEYLGLPRTTLRTLRVNGLKRGTLAIPFYKIGVATYYDVSDLDAYLAACRVEAGEKT